MTDDKTLVLTDLLEQVVRQNLSVVDEIFQGLTDGIAAVPMNRAELAARLADGSVTLLDIQPEDEFAMGHIPVAVQIDWESWMGWRHLWTTPLKLSHIVADPIAAMPNRPSRACVKWV